VAITALSAVTLATNDMAASVRFYLLCGFELLCGGETASFTSFRAGGSFLNLIAEPAEIHWWGRAIFYDGDIDALHARLVAAGHSPAAPPRDASWGERFFHVADPDGHEISFAWPLKR
jgi:uncharacterized glyoxalase superfamily protein PhnB